MEDIDNTLLKELQPGREVLFKRHEGRGRPALGKVISQNSKGLTVALGNRKFERVKPHQLHKVIVKRGKIPEIDPILMAKARQFEKELPVN